MSCYPLLPDSRTHLFHLDRLTPFSESPFWWSLMDIFWLQNNATFLFFPLLTFSGSVLFGASVRRSPRVMFLIPAYHYRLPTSIPILCPDTNHHSHDHESIYECLNSLYTHLFSFFNIAVLLSLSPSRHNLSIASYRHITYIKMYDNHLLCTS